MKQLKRITTAVAIKEGLLNMKNGYTKALARIIEVKLNGYVQYQIKKLAKVEDYTLHTTATTLIIVTKTYSSKTNKEGFLYVLKLYLGLKLVGKTILVDLLFEKGGFLIDNTLLLQLNLCFYKLVNARNKRGINQHSNRNKLGINQELERNTCGSNQELTFISDCNNNTLLPLLNIRIIESLNILNIRIIESLNTYKLPEGQSSEAGSNIDTLLNIIPLNKLNIDTTYKLSFGQSSFAGSNIHTLLNNLLHGIKNKRDQDIIPLNISSQGIIPLAKADTPSACPEGNNSGEGAILLNITHPSNFLKSKLELKERQIDEATKLDMSLLENALSKFKTKHPEYDRKPPS